MLLTRQLRLCGFRSERLLLRGFVLVFLYILELFPSCELKAHKPHGLRLGSCLPCLPHISAAGWAAYSSISSMLTALAVQLSVIGLACP